MICLKTVQRRAPLLTYIGALVATGLVTALITAGATLALEAGGSTVAIVSLAAAVIVGGLTAITLVWWRGLDEAAREAHKWAWWWGGTAGTLFGGLALAALVATGDGQNLAAPLAHLSSIDILKFAVIGLLLCQVVGYGLAWAVWWLARR